VQVVHQPCGAQQVLQHRHGRLRFVRRLTDTGCALWSLKDPRAESTTGPMTWELLFSVFATIARFESERRSQRIRASLARRKAEGNPVGRQQGSADRRSPKRSGYVACWARERAEREGVA
jgi:putative DNA-invertase from lambdoid prophage Rac